MSSEVSLVIAGCTGLAAGAVLTAMVSHARRRKQVALVRRAERRARSAERLAELGSMTSGLAHEIKNPLSTIGLNIQLLAEALAELQGNDEERGRLERRVGTLQREIERLRDILTYFLDFAGEKKLAPAPTDLNAITENSRVPKSSWRVRSISFGTALRALFWRAASASSAEARTYGSGSSSVLASASAVGSPASGP